MNEFELPDDIKVLDKLYISPEDRIKELENALSLSHNNVIFWMNKYETLLKKPSDKQTEY